MKNKANSRGLIGFNSLIQQSFKTFLLIVLIMGVSLSAQGQVFSTQKNISNNVGISQHPQIAVDDEGNIYVAWMDSTNGPHHHIFFSRSTDGGTTFSYPMNISQSNKSSSRPRITVDGQGFVYIVWQGYYGITFSYSSNHGSSFSNPITISASLSATGGAEIAVDSQGNINIVFRAGVYGHWDIFHCRSINGGESFSYPMNISNQIPTGGSWPKIKVDDQGKIYVVWHGPDGIFFSCSTDSTDGLTFSTPTSLTPDLVYWGEWPMIDLDGERNINIVWRNGTSVGNNIFFTRSTNGGVSFSAPINISNSPFQSGGPDISVDNQGNINVVWVEGIYEWEVFYSRSSDGVNFSSPVNISNTPNNDSYPSKIAIDSQDNINIVWTDQSSGIFFSRSTDEGMNFSEPKIIADGIGNHQIDLDDMDNIYIIYQKNPPEETSEVFFSRLIDSLFEDLIDLIEEINLSQGISNSLDAKFDVALRALEDANANNNVAAIHALEAVITQVEHQRGNQITNEDADALIAAVQNILNMLY